MSINSNKRVEVLLDDLTHELKRLNENIERLDRGDDREVSVREEYR